MIGLFFELELAWGFGVRYPKGTAAQMAPPLPPPSTAIGAVAESIAVRYGLPESVREGKRVCSTAYRIRKAVKGAAFALSPESPTGIVVRAEITKIMQIIYTGKKDEKEWTGAQAVASAYAPKAIIYMMVVFDESLLERELRFMGVDDSVERVLEGVTIRRIGSKEGIVAMKSKIVGEAEEEKGVETYFYAKKMDIDENFSTDLLLWEPTKEVFCGGAPKYALYKVPSGPFSAQAVLTPPKKKGVISRGLCLKDYCVEVLEN
ncbi:MAG: hypothetical protein GXO07_06040 [Crenarchaeota archaeon]|nr:hypothetical protein [Thermoproteota archaeon]